MESKQVLARSCKPIQNAEELINIQSSIKSSFQFVIPGDADDGYQEASAMLERSF